MVRHKAGRLLAVLVVMGLMATGCGNSDGSSNGASDDSDEASTTEAPEGGFAPVDAPGVTDTEIRVGGIASVTNPLGGSYETAFEGAKAYFDKVNSDGGVYGRQIKLVEEIDDGAVNNKEAATTLINSDIFAVVPVATLLFSGADALTESGIPTFGWNINAEWGGTEAEPRANLFGQAGSYIGITDTNSTIAYLAKEQDLTKVGILGYNVPQSSECAAGMKDSATKYPDANLEVAYFDDSLGYGEKNLSVQVGKMKDAGVDFVATCLDTNGVVTLATEMDKQGMEAVQYIPNGYNHDFVEQFGDLLEGAIVRTDFAPPELPEEDWPEGLDELMQGLEDAGVTPTDNSIVGWQNARMFVDGLLAAGENFDRQKVVDAINEMTDWTGDGVAYPINWTYRHVRTDDPDISCSVFLTIEDSELVPDRSEPGKPFLCTDGRDPEDLTASNGP
jgi:ABC-type branched-subunit amino acid transport system substrate-binding protein